MADLNRSVAMEVWSRRVFKEMKICHSELHPQQDLDQKP